MGSVTDILTKSGYELQSTGQDVLPATLIYQNSPIGFLNTDMSISLIPAHDNLKEPLEKAVLFGIDNHGLTQMGDEYILTQYGNSALTADYDYQEQKPIYKVYALDNDRNFTIVDSFEDKAIAGQRFAEYSGLISGKALQQDIENNRINKFISNIKDKGYKVLDAENEKEIRRYELFDKNDNIVGYIGRNNRLTLLSDNTKTRNILTDTYRESASTQVMLPSFFERLKEKLKEIGLALKVKFTPSGNHYTINDKNNHIATVDEKHNVSFTPLATSSQIDKVNHLIEDIEIENQARNDTSTLGNPEIKPEIPAVEKNQPVHPVNLTSDVLTEDELRVIAMIAVKRPGISPPLGDELTAKLKNFLRHTYMQKTLDFDKENNKAVTEKSNTKPHLKAPIVENKTAESELSKAQLAVLDNFNLYENAVNAARGFNPEKANSIVEEMKSQFGTANQIEFLSKLKNGDYTQKKPLNQKISDAKDIMNSQSKTTSLDDKEHTIQPEK